MNFHAFFSAARPALLFLLATSALACVPGVAHAQANGNQTGPGTATLELADGTPMLGRLESALYADHSSKGDRVEIQIMHDVTQGHQTVLKKGARVTGRIVKLQNFPEAGGLYGVGIVFDSVTSKNGDALSLFAEIQAIAPPSATGINPITDLPYGGSNQVSANQGVVEPIGAKNQGSVGFPGVALGVETDKGTHISILTSKTGNIHLEKWTQVVLRVVNP
jgi:hypothetical protein